MNIDVAIAAVHGSEVDLADGLCRLADLYAADHEIFHRARELAADAALRLDLLRPVAEPYGVIVDLPADHAASQLRATVRVVAVDLLGRSTRAAGVLLADLRSTCLLARGVEIDWMVLQHAAVAAGSPDLLQVAERCREDVGVCTVWLSATIATVTPQVLSTR